MKVREIGEDESEQRVIDDVAKFRWHCINIHPEGDEVGYAFTVGLFASYGHPELIIIGLQAQTAHAILSIAARAAKDGAPLNLDQSTDALLEGYSCCFGQVSREEYREHVGYCRWFYYGNTFLCIRSFGLLGLGYFLGIPKQPMNFAPRNLSSLLGRTAPNP